MILASILTLPATIAIGLISFAWRGVRIDDHPLCRRCGFDLFGKPADATRCGECGADLSRRHAIRIGHRRKRRGLLATGVFLLLIMLGVGGTVGYGIAKHVNWWHHAPLWYVIRLAGSSDANLRAPALVELNVRFQNGKLSIADINRVVDTGLTYQGNLKTPWDSRWGDLIEDVNDSGKLSLDRLQRYARQATIEPATFSVSARINRGESGQWYLIVPAARLATYSNLSTRVSWSGPEIANDVLMPGDWGPPGGGGRGTMMAFDGITKGRHFMASAEILNQSVPFIHPLSAGTHQIILHVSRSTYGVGSAKLKDAIETVEGLSANFEFITSATTKAK